MNKTIKITSFIFITIPLMLSLPYLFNNWRLAPMDKYNWIFIVLPLLLAGIKISEIKSRAGTLNKKGWVLLSAAILFYFLMLAKHVSSLQYAGAALIIYSGIYLLWGTKLSMYLMPLNAITLLATPNSSYFLEYFLREMFTKELFNGLLLKAVIAIFLSIVFLFYRHEIRIKTLVFSLLVTLTLFILLIKQNGALNGDAMTNNLDSLRIGNYLRYQQPLTEADALFFGDNKATKYLFTSKDKNSITMLNVKISGSIHSIHPAELCLKSGGNSVLSLKEQLIEVNGKKLACQVIVADFDGEKYLIYSWYGNDKFSTGNFLNFRSSWHPGEPWEANQLLLGIDSTTESATTELNKFIAELLKTNQ